VDEILEITLRVTGVCERMGVPYAVVGSLASSLHGIPEPHRTSISWRYLTLEGASAFADALRGDFYLDDDAIRYQRRRYGATTNRLKP
jgi:hypothetical protein